MAIDLPETLTADQAAKYRVSIRLCSDGLSFSGHDPSAGGSFFYRSVEFDRSASALSSLKEFFFTHDFLTWPFRRMDILCVIPEYTIVPDSYSGTGDADRRAMNALFLSAGSHLFSDTLDGLSARLLFGLEEEIYEFCSRSFFRPVFSHYMTPLLGRWGREVGTGTSRMYAMLWRKRLDLVCFRHGKLACSISYQVERIEDMLYYILYLWSRLGLDPETDTLSLWGDSSLRAPLMERLRGYLRHMSPIGIPAEAYLLGEDVAKAPLDLISLLRCE